MKRKASLSHHGFRVGSQLGAAARLALRGYSKYRAASNKRQKTSHRYRGSGGRTITQQHDISTSRGNKRMPKQKKKWVKFVKKVDKAMAHNDALCVLLETIDAPITAVNLVGVNRQMLLPPFQTTFYEYDLRLGAYGSDFTGLRRFIVELRDKQTNSFSGANVERDLAVQANLKQQELYIKSCQMTMSIKNTTNEPSGAYLGGNPSVLFIDIYECVTRDDVGDSTFNNAALCWQNSLLQTTGPNAVNVADPIIWAKVAPDQSGCTPYQAPGFGKYWKVLKKTRVSIGADQKVNYTMSGYKGKVQFAEDMNTVCLSKGKVKDLMIVVNPTFNGDIVASQKPIELEWSKTYNFNWTNGPGNKASYCGSYAY